MKTYIVTAQKKDGSEFNASFDLNLLAGFMAGIQAIDDTKIMELKPDSVIIETVE